MLTGPHASRRRLFRPAVQSWLLSFALVLFVGLPELVLVKAHADATTEAADLLEEYTAISNSSLKWVQRPNLYFGMRARVQGDSPLFGIAWYGLQDYNGYQSQLQCAMCGGASGVLAYNSAGLRL